MTTSFYRKSSSSLWLSGILIFSDRCWADVQELVTGQRKTLFLGEGKLRFFSVHHSKWNETFTWRDYTMSIIVSLCLSMAHKECLVRNIKWFSFNRWLWVSLVIARLWRRRQVNEQDSAPGAAMTWRQRLVLWRTKIRYYWCVLDLWHAVSCLKVELSWGNLEIGISFPFLNQECM